MKLYVLYIIIILTFVDRINTQVVCSEDELIRDILNDLADNGKLDCLRKSVTPLEGNETTEQKQLRLNAEWKSDCSFEADGDNWISKLTTNYQLSKGLVDVNGKAVERDFDDQADMCEIIRALVANGKFPEIGDDVNHIDTKIVDYINCPGGDSQTKVCAATASSFPDQGNWFILLEGSSITVNDEPKHTVIIDKNSMK